MPIFTFSVWNKLKFELKNLLKKMFLPVAYWAWSSRCADAFPPNALCTSGSWNACHGISPVRLYFCAGIITPVYP